MYVFGELKALLRSDERASKPVTRVGKLEINKVNSWQTDATFFDLALEQMAANAQMRKDGID